MSLSTESITSLRAKLTSGDIQPSDILDSLAESIDAKNGDIGAYLSYDLETAKAEANAADLSKPLGGIPIAIKDNICTTSSPTTCGSKMMAGFVSGYNAHVVECLEREGAIILGKTNLDEFSMGSSAENSAFGPTCNPWDMSRVPGGSSGG